MTALLAQWMETLKSLPEYQSFVFPKGTDSTVGNIARGERLKGCPYLIADLPRLFHPKGHFALRTLFWWGHGFTFFWHISGSLLNPFGQKLLEHQGGFPSSTRISVTGNEWEHDLQANNYCDRDEGGSNKRWQQAQENGFVKLAMPWPLDKWDRLEEVGLEFTKAGLAAMKG